MVLLFVEYFSKALLTQFGNRLCFPEAISALPGLLHGRGQTCAQGEEAERSLDLLLLTF